MITNKSFCTGSPCVNDRQQVCLGPQPTDAIQLPTFLQQDHRESFRMGANRESPAHCMVEQVRCLKTHCNPVLSLRHTCSLPISMPPPICPATPGHSRVLSRLRDVACMTSRSNDPSPNSAAAIMRQQQQQRAGGT